MVPSLEIGILILALLSDPLDSNELDFTSTFSLNWFNKIETLMIYFWKFGENGIRSSLDLLLDAPWIAITLISFNKMHIISTIFFDSGYNKLPINSLVCAVSSDSIYAFNKKVNLDKNIINPCRDE